MILSSKLIKAKLYKYISHVQREYEVGLVVDLLAPGEKFIDIGANKGTYIYGALRANATVLAIEPIPELASHLEQLFANEEVEILEFAVGKFSGETDLFIPTENSRRISTRASLSSIANMGFQLEQIKVNVAPLDSLVSIADFVKVDVEGNELEVLESSISLLKTQHPTIMCEAEVRHHPDNPEILNQCFTFLESLGYKGFFISPLNRKLLEPISKFDSRRYQRIEANKKAGSLRHDPNYVNNFLFIHDSRLAALSKRVLLKGWKLAQA